MQFNRVNVSTNTTSNVTLVWSSGDYVNATNLGPETIYLVTHDDLTGNGGVLNISTAYEFNVGTSITLPFTSSGNIPSVYGATSTGSSTVNVMSF